MTHQHEMRMSDGGFLAEDWEIVGEAYYAKKECTKEAAAEGVVEVGTFKLYHRPK